MKAKKLDEKLKEENKQNGFMDKMIVLDIKNEQQCWFKMEPIKLKEEYNLWKRQVLSNIKA